MEKDKTLNDNSQGKKGLEDFVNDMLQNEPEVQQHVVDNEKIKSSITDAGGREFNPEIHLSDNGRPLLTRTGRFRKKPKNVINNPFEESDKIVQNDAMNMDSRASAELLQSLKRQVYEGVFAYRYSDERHILHVTATTEYFISEGGIKLTPLQNLLILEGFMGLELIRTEKGVKKVGKLKAWLVGKWLKMKGNKNGSQFDSRADNERQNDAGEKIADSAKK